MMLIRCQSEDNCPSNLGTSVLWGPTEVSRRRTIQTINLRSDATPAPVHTTDPLHSANSKAIWQSLTNPRPICQSNANPMPIHEEICTTKYEFCQFSTNLVILCQSWTNSQILCQSSANPMRICQSTNHWPIQGKSHRQDIGTH